MSENRKIVVVGAGLMGSGIAHGFAAGGCNVLLVDTSREVLDTATAEIGATLNAGVARGKLSAADAAAAKARVEVAQELDDRLSGAALLVETATELLDVKHAILSQASRFLPAGCIIGTNTSALSISEIAKSAADPTRVIGMHFFNPVAKMKLVELILGVETTRECLDEAIAWVGVLGKEHIIVNEAPGFTTSRMSALMGNEAMYMLAEGVASAEDIDKSLRMAFNFPMGPLELGDLTGWDTRLKVLHYLHGALGSKFRPCPLISKMVAAGHYGRKTGRGVYQYDEAGQRIPGSGLKVGL